MEAFKTAITRAVKPGNIVVDVGCGTGVLGLLCLQAGAMRVWGINSTPAIELARETMARAGLSDRYLCRAERSFQAILPEKADVVICDHVGYFGIDYSIIETLQDARRRFLKPGGVLLPSRLKLFLGAVQSDHCRKLTDAWSAAAIPMEFHWLRNFSVHSKHAVTLASDDILGAPAELGTIDLGADQPDFFSFQTVLHIARDGRLDGLAGWFECELTEGVWMTNSPLSKDAIRRDQAFLPIDQPIDVTAGDTLNVTIQARPSDGLLAWTVEVPSTGRRSRYSTFSGMILSKEQILKSQPNRVPKLNRTGAARQTVMAYCDGKRTAREIEQAVLRDHSDLFPTKGEISRFVLGTLGRDTD